MRTKRQVQLTAEIRATDEWCDGDDGRCFRRAGHWCTLFHDVEEMALWLNGDMATKRFRRCQQCLDSEVKDG